MAGAIGFHKHGCRPTGGVVTGLGFALKHQYRRPLTRQAVRHRCPRHACADDNKIVNGIHIHDLLTGSINSFDRIR